MKLTETMLLDGFTGLTNAGSLISTVKGCRIIWNYRRHNEDGVGACVCSRQRADVISLEYDRTGSVELDPTCEDHPGLAKIEAAEAEAWGTAVPDA